MSSPPARPTPGGVIVATKLHLPVPRLDLVPRGALIATLTAPGLTRLTLLAAPAGTGKTTLLSEWAASDAEERPFAWLSLEEDENDPVRFWELVIEALCTIEHEVGAAADAALRAPGTDLADEVLPLLINDLTERGMAAVLALDDYQVIRDREIHDSLAFFIDHLPAGLHVALATRADPPLPLPRLRASGELVELRVADLRFTDDEATAMLNGTLGLGLAAQEIAQLQRRTEGWAAGLQLAGLSLRGRADHAGFIDSFAGDDRQVTDYLATEVLDAESPERREFMLRTSLLDRLSAPLCDAVTGGGGGERRLVDLDRDNLFVIPLDSSRTWYRYHRLFADVLQARLHREDPAAVPEVHRKAAAWYERNGSPEDAIRHSLAGGDTDTAAELVGAHWSEAFNQGRLATVSRWLDALPEELLRSDSRLWLARAWTALDRARLDEIRPWLEVPSEAAEHEAWAGLLRGLHRLKVGDVASARESVESIIDGAEQRPDFWRTVAEVLLGMVRYWGSDARRARAAFDSGLALARADSNGLASVYALGYLALLDLEEGDPTLASRRLDEAAGLWKAEPAIGEHFTAMIAHVAAAKARELDGRLDAATAELDRAIELARRGAGALELGLALVERARIARAAGDSERARELVDEARSIADGCADPGRLAGLARAGPATRASERNGHELSDRERRVLALLPSQLSLREIGGELYVSLNTVKTHVRNVYRKLGASSRDEAVTRARERGLI